MVTREYSLEVSAAPRDACDIERRAEHHIGTFALVPMEVTWSTSAMRWGPKTARWITVD